MMTDKEKIDYIKEAINTYFLFNSLTRSDRADVEEMIDTLEKQVAKKRVNTYDCPICGSYTEYDDGHEMNYCPECGQKLEW